MNLPDVFLKALEENEDDLTTRLVYSDWLEEQGEYEEADRQRRWPGAKAWLKQFAENDPHFRGYGDEEEDPRYSPYAKLLYFLTRHVEGEHYLYFDTPYGFKAYSDELWMNFTIVTGLQPPMGAHRHTMPPFHCAC